jgi:hypothetical protein
MTALTLTVLAFAFVLSASASSIKGSYDTALSGVSKSTVQSSFSFNTTNDKLTGTLLFAGVFTGTKNISQTLKCAAQICDLVLDSSINGDKITYDFVLNLKSDTFSATGNVWKGKKDGSFAANGYASLPEGGSTFAYLGIAGLVIFGGMLSARSRGATLR